MATTFHIQTEMLNEKHWIFSDFVTVTFCIYWNFSQMYQSSPFDAFRHMHTCQHTCHSFMCVKNNMHHFCTLIVWAIRMKKIKERSKILYILNSWSFCFNLYVFLAWMLHFYIWLHSMGKILSLEWYYI